MAKPFHVTDQDFQQKVLESSGTVVTDFWAAWCGPCKAIAPVLDQIAQEYDGKLSVAKLDVDANNSTAMAYGVFSIPTLIVFKDGKPVDRIVGFLPKERLLNRITPHLS